MQITRSAHPIFGDGKCHTMEIDVTKEQLDRWRCGEMIQNAMSNVSAEEREFIMSGITPEQWKKVFG